MMLHCVIGGGAGVSDNAQADADNDNVIVQMLLPLLATHYAHATVALRQALQRPTSLS